MKRNIAKIDKTLLIVTLLLSIFGLIMIYSASSISAVLQYKQTQYYFFTRQAIFIIAGIFIFLVLINIHTKKYNIVSKLLILGIIGLLVALRSYGTITNSAKSWFRIFGFSIQPSEFAKTIIIVYLACWYGIRKKFNNFTDLLLPLVPCVIIAFLVATEPDLGTAAIIAFICMFIFFTLPLKNKYYNIFRFGAMILLIGGILLLNSNTNFLTSTQASRFNFKNPCKRYLEETGYQVCNGYIAINNGGFLGLGLGKSTQKYLYLPEAHTDFIFPIIVEELGLVGGGLVLILYMILLYRILAIARNAKDLKGSIVAFGTFAYILTHICVNLGGLLALIPLTGVPLPFMSYGGSFMINLYILIALTQRVKIETSLGGSKNV